MPAYSLSPMELTETQSRITNENLTGVSDPSRFSSNLVGGYKTRRTYKKFMRGRKNYKKSVKSYLSSSSGMFSKLINKFRGTKKRK